MARIGSCEAALRRCEARQPLRCRECHLGTLRCCGDDEGEGAVRRRRAVPGTWARSASACRAAPMLSCGYTSKALHQPPLVGPLPPSPHLGPTLLPPPRRPLRVTHAQHAALDKPQPRGQEAGAHSLCGVGVRRGQDRGECPRGGDEGLDGGFGDGERDLGGEGERESGRTVWTMAALTTSSTE